VVARLEEAHQSAGDRAETARRAVRRLGVLHGRDLAPEREDGGVVVPPVEEATRVGLRKGRGGEGGEVIGVLGC
jgi:hypothetical protein